VHSEVANVNTCLKNTRKTFYVFRQEGNVLYFEDILHDFCFIFQIMPLISLFYLISVLIIFIFFINHVPEFKYPLICLSDDCS